MQNRRWVPSRMAEVLELVKTKAGLFLRPRPRVLMYEVDESTATRDEQESPLLDRLSNHGRQSFKKLCKEPEDAALLALWFGQMASPLKFAADGPVAGRSLSLRPLDSEETALDPKDGSYSVGRGEIKKASEAARYLADFIPRFVKTPASEALQEKGYIGKGDLLYSHIGVTGPLRALASLPKDVGELLDFRGDRRPSTDELLEKIYDHIEKRWGLGHFLDSDVCNILTDLDIGKDTEALKAWRARRGYTRARSSPDKTPRKVTKHPSK